MIPFDENPTGGLRYRAKSRWFGDPLLVLQIEVHRRWGEGPPDINGMPMYLAGEYTCWRDATVTDLPALRHKGLDL